MSNKKICLECIDGLCPAYPDENTTLLDKEIDKSQLDSLIGLDEPRFIEIKPSAIFKEGLWNGFEYSRADILQMVTNYHKLKDTWIPTIKVSHNQGEFLTSTEYGEQANGRITDMWEENGTIFASFEFDLYFYKYVIAEKRLNHKSVEIWSSVNYNGIEYENVISNVALLGISMPGCGDLGEIENANSVYRVYEAKNPETKVMKFEILDIDEGNKKMANEEKKDISADTIEKDTVEEIKSTEVNTDDEKKDKLSEDANEDASVEEDEEEEEVIDTETPEKVEQSFQVPESKEVFSKEELDIKLNELKNTIVVDFQKKLDEQNFIIESFRKERIETKINHDVEDLIKAGHVKPANRELCKELFNTLSDTAKINFDFNGETIEEPSTLLNRFLKTYSAWQTESVTEGDNIDTDLENALPVTKKNEKTVYNGKELKACGVEISDEAKALQKKYKSEGTEKTFIECYEEILKRD